MLQFQGLQRLAPKRFASRAYHLGVAAQVCRFFKAPGRDVRVIAVEHLRGEQGTQAPYATDLSVDVETVLCRYSWR